MVDMLSPLKSKCVAGHFGANGAAGITLGTRPLNGLWQIAGWSDFDMRVAPILNDLDLSRFGSYRQAQTNGAVTAWRIAPDKLLLEGAGDLSKHACDDLALLDLGHAKVAITLQGAMARDLLAQVVSIDTTVAEFAVGDFVQTGIHHVGVLIQCRGGNSFDILVPGTWAETVWEVLQANALPHGLAIVEAV